jgi:hypothetical protein
MTPVAKFVSRRRLLSGAITSAVCVCFVLGHARADSKPDVSGDAIEAIQVDARRIKQFAKSDGGRQTFGRLTFRGGLVLTSPSSKFGGWSGLEVDADGQRLLAVSDAGVWMTGQLTYDGTSPSGIRDARVGPITGIGGAPLLKDRDRDAESVTLIEGTLSKGTVLVSFEQNHRIGRFPISDKGLGAPSSYLTLPPDVKRQQRNKSLESVCTLRGGPNKGAVITLSERFPDKTGKQHTGWMLPAGQPAAASAWTTLSIRNIGEYDLTDCKGLADGSLLVLERRFRWSTWYEGVKMRLRRFSAAEIRGGVMMEGEVLLDADMDYDIDNMEGLSVHRSPKGETVLTMIADDNFNSFVQRTVLLQFVLADAPAVASPQAAVRP